MSENETENGRAVGREAIKAAVRSLIEKDRSYDETRAMVEDAFPEVSPKDMASIVKEIGSEIRAQIVSGKKATDALLYEMQETKERTRNLSERIDVVEGGNEDKPR